MHPKMNPIKTTTKKLPKQTARTQRSEGKLLVIKAKISFSMTVRRLKNNHEILQYSDGPQGLTKV